ncbi:MAG: site-2 protease family protein, partial [Thermoplasmata archaeon]
MEWKSYPDESNVEEIKRIVEKYFTVYDVKIEDVIAFFIDLPIDEEILIQRFDFLRQDLKKRNLVPFLRKREGEFIIFIVYRKPIKGRAAWINIALFITTIVTTMLSGALLFLEQGEGWRELFSIDKLLNGLIFFSLPLLAILGIHELGHYFTSRRHGVAASLPFFIPLPPNPILPLGTMGAVISMREPIPDRRKLLDIGVAGPIAGFLVSIPILIIGLSMSSLISLSEIPEGAPLLGDNLF